MPQAGLRWLFVAAAAVPCVLLLVFCGIALNEWWLIRTNQIAVIPAPTRGMTTVVNVSAASLLPWILGSGVLAAMFGYALVRRSRAVLLASYATLALVFVVAHVRRML